MSPPKEDGVESAMEAAWKGVSWGDLEKLLRFAEEDVAR